MAFVQLRGVPSLPPNSAPEKLFYLIALAGLIGAALDLLGCPPLVGRLTFILFPAICLAGFSLRPLLAGPDVGLLIKLAFMWAGAAIVLWRICVANARSGALAGAILILSTAVTYTGAAKRLLVISCPGDRPRLIGDVRRRQSRRMPRFALCSARPKFGERAGAGERTTATPTLN
jgi:hypothetical protein